MTSTHIQRITNASADLIEQINPLLDDAWDVEQGERFLANPDNALFLAFWEQHTVVGFLTAHRLQRFDARIAEVLLYEVAVHEDYQQRGIGTLLIDAVKGWAKEVGAANVWVLTYDTLPAAMALYRSTGGEEDEPGTRMFTYWLL